jgi:hypothetical protein
LLAASLFLSASRFAVAVLPPYVFLDFEKNSDWHIGPIPANQSSLHLAQGAASVISFPEPDSRQALQLGPSRPFPAVLVNTSAIAKGVTAYCELLVRPPAVGPDTGNEFLDFGGATLAFFKNGGHGEICAFHATSAGQGVWISSGIEVSLADTGVAAQWLRIDIRLDRASGRWDLLLDGQPALSGLQAVPGEAGSLPLWLYGDEIHPTLVDDVLLSVENPERLEKMIAWQAAHGVRSHSDSSHPVPKTVNSGEQNRELRSAHPQIQEITEKLTAPILRDWKAVLESAGMTSRSGPLTNIKGEAVSLIAHGVSYDDSGKPLPGSLTIVADAELKPGADLSRIKWVVAEVIDFPDKLGAVMASGDFSSGLVQMVPISGEWMKKFAVTYVWTSGDRPTLDRLIGKQSSGSPAAK